MKSLSTCMRPSLKSRLANLGVHTHEISTLHPPKYLAPTLPSTLSEPDIRRAGSPLPALCLSISRHRSHSLDHGVH